MRQIVWFVRSLVTLLKGLLRMLGIFTAFLLLALCFIHICMYVLSSHKVHYLLGHVWTVHILQLSQSLFQNYSSVVSEQFLL